jgi:hypothetical protein
LQLLQLVWLLPRLLSRFQQLWLLLQLTPSAGAIELQI